jgi:hypothetical protein
MIYLFAQVHPLQGFDSADPRRFFRRGDCGIDHLANAVDFVDLKCRFDVTAKTARVREACVGGENIGRPGFKQIQQGAIPK